MVGIVRRTGDEGKARKVTDSRVRLQAILSSNQSVCAGSGELSLRDQNAPDDREMNKKRSVVEQTDTHEAQAPMPAGIQLSNLYFGQRGALP